jgi:hypothetical protein
MVCGGLEGIERYGMVVPYHQVVVGVWDACHHDGEKEPITVSARKKKKSFIHLTLPGL